MAIASLIRASAALALFAATSTLVVSATFAVDHAEPQPAPVNAAPAAAPANAEPQVAPVKQAPAVAPANAAPLAAPAKPAPAAAPENAAPQDATAKAAPAAAPTTQPVAEPVPAPQAGGAESPATQPADLKAQAEERHKHLDERWKQINESQRAAARTRWGDAAIAQTFKPGALVQLSLQNDVLKIETTDLTTPLPVRLAVEGSKAVWMLGRPRPVVGVGGGASGSYVNLTRYDFDAKDDEPWQSRIFINNKTISFFSVNLYGSTNISQSNGMVTCTVSEFTQIGQPQKVIFTAQAPSLMQLRNEHPEEFRMYVLPVLGRFADPSFLLPGAADIYSVFTDIPADPKITAEVEQLIPQLDDDDPAGRDAASAKLRQLGAGAALAAMRIDDRSLSEEQKLRLKSFVAGFHRRPTADAVSERHNINFLIDCLEFDDPAVRAAAKSDLEKLTHQTIDFDPSMGGKAASNVADTLRKQALNVAPKANPSATTQATPQA